MSIYDLKPRFQALLRPVCASLAAKGITANQITLLALLLSLASGCWILSAPGSPWPYLWLPVALFLRMALNAIDGMLAREHDQKSPAGALLNEMGDVLSDLFLYLPFAAAPGFVPEVVVAIVILAVLTETAGLAALLIGAPRNYRGPMGKSDRAFVFGLLAFLIGVGVPAAPWMDALLVLMILLLILTVWNRCRSALRETSS
jgi:CDP-diacylglycerol--glycerol-3-phosphate 3-phosphatidyltransferase